MISRRIAEFETLGSGGPGGPGGPGGTKGGADAGTASIVSPKVSPKVSDVSKAVMDIARLVTAAKRLGDLEAADKADGAGRPLPIDAAFSDAEVEAFRRGLEGPDTGWEERGRTPGGPPWTDPPGQMTGGFTTGPDESLGHPPE